VGLADFDLLGYAGDDFLRALQGLAAARINVHRAVVIDVNFRAGFRDDTFDRLAAGTDDQPDFFRIDLDRLDSRRVFAELGSWLRDRGVHHFEDFRARGLRFEN